MITDSDSIESESQLKNYKLSIYLVSLIGRDADLVVVIDCQVPANDLIVHFL